MKVRTRKRGRTWSYAFEAGHVDGRRRTIEKGGYPTQAAAYEAGTEALVNWKHGNIGITSERMTVAEYMGVWLEHVKDSARPNTLRYYKATNSCWIEPYIGSVVLQELTPALLDGWMRSLYEHGYAKGSLNDARAVLRTALTYAVYPGQLIPASPCSRLQIPRNAPEHKVERKIIPPELYQKLLDTWPSGTPMHLPVLILYHTGLRLGELLGLHWDDIDFGQGTLSVRRQLTYNKKLAPLKTQASYRTIYLAPALLKALEEEKEQQEMREDLFGDEYILCEETADHTLLWHSAGYPARGARVHPVCLWPDGRPVVHGYIIAQLHHVGLNSHSFRHTQATRLAEAGVPPVAAAARLGHANTSMTLNLYTHNTDEQQKRIVAQLASADKTANADKLQTRKSRNPDK